MRSKNAKIVAHPQVSWANAWETCPVIVNMIDWKWTQSPIIAKMLPFRSRNWRVTPFPIFGDRAIDFRKNCALFPAFYLHFFFGCKIVSWHLRILNEGKPITLVFPQSQNQLFHHFSNWNSQTCHYILYFATRFYVTSYRTLLKKSVSGNRT